MPQALREPANRLIYLGGFFLAIIMFVSGLVLYWSVDTEYPMTGVSGVFRGWDANDPNIARVEWTGQRWRYCDGVIYRWVINDGKYVKYERDDFYREGELTEEEKGKSETVYAEIRLPPEVRKNLKNAKYRIRILYTCNPLQHPKLSPLIVAPPEISLTEKESSGDEASGVQHSELTP